MQENNKLVSVIVPVYNVEKYLAQCIDSIINQTYKNLEIILVNDGSPDNSGKIADDYATQDERIKVIHQKNSGVSAARNAGINRSIGDYICFADADDYLMPDYVEYLLNLAIQNNADVSLTTEMFTTYYQNQTKKDTIETYSSEEATAAILYYNMPIGVYCKMFKRDFIGDKIRFLPDFFIGEGFNFNTAAFQRANKVVLGHRKIYYYRRDNSDSAMTKFSINKCINGLKAIDNIKKDFIIDTHKINVAWQYANWHTHCDMYYLIVIASVEKEYPEICKKCLHIARKEAHNAFLAPIKLREKIRAFIIMIYPKLIANLIIWRRKYKNKE